MDAPPVQYVKTSDGYDIAYCVSGGGTPLVLMPQLFSNLELTWQGGGMRSLYESLAARFRLIQFDSRGSGSSSRGLGEEHSVSQHSTDLECLARELAITRFVLVGMLHYTHSTVAYASQHPGRVRALILVNPTAPDAAWGDLPTHYGELARNSWSLFIDTFSHTFRGGDTSGYSETMSQADFLAEMRAAQASDVTGLVSDLKTPTLIVGSRQARMPGHAEAYRRMAALIPGSKLVLLDGIMASVITSRSGDPPVVPAIVDFLKNIGARTEPHRVSDRELEVLCLLAAGKSNQEIADELVISVNTVRRHVSNIFDKTGVANRAQAVAYARDHGIG
jgi:DNA-binding NarL/FixJ family response regulator